MTLKPIENEFSERLQSALKEEKFPLDLTLHAPPIDLVHPKVLWATLLAERDPELEYKSIIIPGWNYACFASVDECSKYYPEIETILLGKPFELYQFMNSPQATAIFDFSPLGAVVLSKDSLTHASTPGLHAHTLPEWLSYALSPELWGEQGKWTRFHSRLHHLFSETNLLKGDDFPGYYPLKEEAQKLVEHGLIGTKFENSYLLVLPWSFPLSALQKLEEVVRQEF